MTMECGAGMQKPALADAFVRMHGGTCIED